MQYSLNCLSIHIVMSLLNLVMTYIWILNICVFSLKLQGVILEHLNEATLNYTPCSK